MNNQRISTLLSNIANLNWASATERTWLLMAIFVVIVAVCIAAVFSTWPWNESPWAAAAAIATFSAALSALHISRREEKRRIKREKQHASIVAAQAIVILDVFHTRIESQLLARALMSFGKKGSKDISTIYPSADSYQTHLILLQDFINGMHNDILSSALIIPDGFSGRVAALKAGSQLLSGKIENIRFWSKHLSSHQDKPNEDVEMYWSKLGQLGTEALRLSEVAQIFFNSVTGTTVPLRF